MAPNNLKNGGSSKPQTSPHQERGGDGSPPLDVDCGKTRVRNGGEAAGNSAAGWSDESEEEGDPRREVAEDWRFLQGYGVDERDAGTADSWVRRHPDLVRLTGRHPFNSEPPLPRLMSAGFFTPTSLHYVRNHGYVPRADTEELQWRVEVSGLVACPTSFTVQQIKREFKPRALPVTLVCAGNRRKEVNLVKQTVGFNWGPSALGTSVWKGAKLCDVLRRVGVRSRRQGAHFVCFEGAEKLPGGGGSTYGTSLALDVAMDEANDILLAYEQNGKELKPDHGFPIRMIIPGYIGGRMVKWLTRVLVTSEESTNFYHFRDNRVLPSHVDADKADAEGWWSKREYIINELNINSVVTTPAHAEVLTINARTVRAPYICKGYAYSGGGRKVIRVEVSLDGGETWKLCDLTHTEKPTKYGKYFCWCFWELEIEMTELLSAKELVVRAWDQAMNTQPKNLTWNVMGMMNNCWFRVKLHPSKCKEGEIRLTFEHPVRPGNETGGWMMKQNEDQDYAPSMLTSKPLSSPVPGPRQQQITIAEVRQHRTQDSAWIVVNNKVYDCTRFLEAHPGGKDSIMINAGTDCTEDFLAIHSDKAKDMLQSFYVGELAVFREGDSEGDGEPNSSVQVETALSALQLKKVAALDPKESTSFRLVGKESLGQSVRRFRFALQSPHHVLGLPIGNHVIVRARPNGKLAMRAYTPIATPDQLGFFDLVVKIYVRDQHPKFPMGGLMSQYMDKLQVGDTIDIRGPLGRIEYVGRGLVIVSGQPRRARSISMVAGGTGITPLYQIIQAIVHDSQDETQVSLIYANHREEDILLRDQLDKWQHTCKNVRVWYTVTHASRTWQYSIGRLTEPVMKEHLFPPCPTTVALLCGPQAMCEDCCIPNLLNMGYDEDSCFIF